MSRIEEALRRAGRPACDPVEISEVEDLTPSVVVMQGATDLPDVGEYASEAGPPREQADPAALSEAADQMRAPSPSGADDPAPAVDEAPVAAAAGSEASVTAVVGSGAPAIVVEQPRRVHDRVVTGGAVPSTAVEQYRRLAATLYHVQAERGAKIVMVASAMVGEGKTLTAANLAVTLSGSFQRSVLLIDADLRRPTLHELFGVPNVSGLNDRLNAERDGKLSLVEVSPQLTVLPAGRPNRDPMSALTSERMRRIIEEASEKFDWVVLDTPPIGLLPDANLLAKMVDMVVLVVGASSTPLRAVRGAVDALTPERIVGVVLNRVAEPSGDYYYDRYYAGAASGS